MPGDRDAAQILLPGLSSRYEEDLVEPKSPRDLICVPQMSIMDRVECSPHDSQSSPRPRHDSDRAPLTGKPLALIPSVENGTRPSAPVPPGMQDPNGGGIRNDQGPGRVFIAPPGFTRSTGFLVPRVKIVENGRLWAQRKDRNLRNFSVPATGLFRRFGWATLTGEVRIGAPHDAESHAGGQSAERQRPGAEHGGVRLCRASARRCGWTTWPMPGRLAGPSVAAAVRARLVLAPSGARPRRSRSRARRCMTAVRSGSPGRGALCLQYHWGATSPLRNQATPPSPASGRAFRDPVHIGAGGAAPACLPEPVCARGGEHFSRAAGSFLPTWCPRWDSNKTHTGERGPMRGSRW